jgi:hypothetical protein
VIPSLAFTDTHTGGLRQISLTWEVSGSLARAPSRHHDAARPMPPRHVERHPGPAPARGTRHGAPGAWCGVLPSIIARGTNKVGGELGHHQYEEDKGEVREAEA